MSGEPIGLRTELGAVTATPQLSIKQWRVALSYRWRGFITRERTISYATDGTLSLTLHDDGSVTGEVTADTMRTSTVSKYASHDGEHHRYENSDEASMILRGVWSQGADATMITLTSFSRSTAPDESSAPEGLATMRCWQLSGGALPMPMLGCRVEGHAPAPLTQELVVDAGTATTGAEPGSDPRTSDNRWVILGAMPGVKLDWRGSDRRPLSISMTPLEDG